MKISMSLVGIVTLFALAWLLSDNRKAINLRTVSIAFAIQITIAALSMSPYGARR